MITQIFIRREELAKIPVGMSVDLGPVPEGSIFRHVDPDFTQEEILIAEYESPDETPTAITVGWTEP